MDNGTRTIALSAATSLIVSTLVITTGMQLLPSNAVNNQPSAEEIADIERDVWNDSPIVSVVQKTEPAVVSVIISKDLPVLERSYESGPFGIRIPRTIQRGTERTEIGGGTAFFISADGLMLTNKHVVSDTSASYTVLLNDGRTLEAKVVARDFLTDIALLKVDGNNFPYLALSSNDEPILGQTVVAIGNALGEFRNTVSVGVVSGLQRTITAGNPYEGTIEKLSRIIQTDAAINEGNSGGPLLNVNGEVLGMNTAVASNAQNIGFAIPVLDLRRAVESYQEYGRIVRPYLGVRYIVLTPQLAQQQNLAFDYGVIIASGNNSNEPAIVSNSPAANAGLRENDVILEADGQRLTEDVLLGDIIQRKKPGDTLKLRISRDGDERELDVILQESEQ